MTDIYGNQKEQVKSCNGCIFYYITWDRRAPKGCKYFGFKSTKMPCQVVLSSTGSHCTMYTKRRGQGNA